MFDETPEKKLSMAIVGSKESQQIHSDAILDFLLRSGRGGILYRNNNTAYLIPTQRELGYSLAPLRPN